MHKNHLTCADAASPPDVRRGFATPSAFEENFGAMPPVRPFARKLWGKARTAGIARWLKKKIAGKA